MRRTRLVSIAALIAAGSLALAACSSSSGGGSAKTSAAATSGGQAGGKVACSSGKLNGEGSSAQANAMTQWIKDYQHACSGATINYNPTGSGDGVTAFNGNQVDFAGSDAALDPAAGEVAAAQKRCGSVPLNIPMVVGPIAIAYNLKGVDKLVLNGPTIAKIFLGQIKTWNDPAIKALNKSASLPSTAITPFYRADSSGTTKNFENYLAATASSIFKATPDKDSSGAHFAGQGKSLSQGVSDAVSQTNGGITYVEFSYAVSSGLSTAQIDNGGGAVALSKDTASAAAGAATVTGTGNDLTLKIDYAQKTPGAYPLILVTYEIVCTKYSDSATGTFVKNFLSYTSTGGQDSLAKLGYAPLPTALLSKAQKSVAAIS